MYGTLKSPFPFFAIVGILVEVERENAWKVKMRDVESEEFRNDGSEQLKFETCVLGKEKFQKEVRDLMFLGRKVIMALNV